MGDNNISLYTLDGQIELKFESKAWLRKQIIYKDKDNRQQIGFGKKFKNFNEFLKKGDVILLKKQDTIYSISQIPKVNGAIVVIDPNTGRVLPMTGGYQFAKSEFNRVIQAQRQPGSAFKPFVYLAALDKGYAPNTKILDAPLVIDQGPGKKKWKPANYTKRFYGPSIMRLGIEKSRNLMTARLAMNLGMEKVQEYARRFGLNDNLPPLLSMSLGA